MLGLRSGKVVSLFTSVDCDLGVRTHLSAWTCMVPCHPVLIGNIPDLICVNLLKKYAGTPIWEDCTRVYQCKGCDLGGSKCESPHLSAWSCMVPCHPALIHT